MTASGIRLLTAPVPESCGRPDDEAVKDHVHGGHQENDRGHAHKGPSGQEGTDRSDHVHAGVGGDAKGRHEEAAAAGKDLSLIHI